MADYQLHPNEIQCALRMDGHHYQRKHPEFSFTNALHTFRQTGTWDHLSLPEAMATLSLLYKALQLWQRSSYASPSDLTEHYQAFHSLYDRLKDVPISND